jgi:endoglucanase
MIVHSITGNKKHFNQSTLYSAEEKATPWMGKNTAKHYEWYPFHNFGHYEFAKVLISEE